MHIPLSKFQNGPGVTLLGASPQAACEGGVFLDVIDPGEMCGRSGAAQHSASRSTLSTAQAVRRRSV